ncbi:MAG: FAD-dependent oxidoreductase [Bacteroidales bacterium]|jgi:all-trans-retinol 13,14-reductase|nr:FAD-dependent oxidoreductase [Bacteroidales bacterium]
MSNYDVVIIGSGLGGLLCGNILSKEGKKVCIIEKQHQFGGCLQTFKRKGNIFDTGIHYIGGMDQGQNLNQYFKYFGILDQLKLKRLDKDAFDIIHLKNKNYPMAQGFDHFIETFSHIFPKERANLVEYKNQIKKICEAFPLYNLEAKLNYEAELTFYEKNIQEFLQSITQNKTLQQVLAGNNFLYAGDPAKTPLFIHALIENSFIESAWRFVDGSSQLADALIQEIKKHGGTLLKNREVVKLHIQKKSIEFAEINTGEKISGKNFISAVHPSQTLKMIDEHNLRKSYRTRLSELENTISVFVLYASLKPGRFKYLNSNYYHFKENDVWTVPNYDPAKWPQNYLFLTPPSSESKQFAPGAIAMTYMKYHEVVQWKDTTIGNRGSDYKAFKQEKAEKFIDEINHQFPDFKKSIQYYETSTPLTYRDYTGTAEGSMYGIVRDCNHPLQTKISTRTKIPNLLFTGQNINMHGVLGVTVGAVLTCSELTGLEYLINKINHA